MSLRVEDLTHLAVLAERLYKELIDLENNCKKGKEFDRDRKKLSKLYHDWYFKVYREYNDHTTIAQLCSTKNSHEKIQSLTSDARTFQALIGHVKKRCMKLKRPRR